MNYKKRIRKIGLLIPLLLSSIQISNSQEVSYSGVVNGFEYEYSKTEFIDTDFFDLTELNVIYFFNYKCPYSYKNHNMISFLKRSNRDINFYNIPLSEEYSLDIFILSKYFNYSFEDELTFYKNLIPKIRSQEHKNIYDLYSSLLGVSSSAIYSIMESDSFNEKKDFIKNLSKINKSQTTPYAIVISGDRSFEVRGNNNPEPINFTLSISEIIKKINTEKK